MSRRVSLPGASELFRATHAPEQVQPTHAPDGEAGSRPGKPRRDLTPPSAAPNGDSAAVATAGAIERGSGRVRHDEKITVYVSQDELLALEQARLTLRARHGQAVDRGRIVREAIAAALQDLDDRAGDSELVRRLSAS